MTAEVPRELADGKIAVRRPWKLHAPRREFVWPRKVKKRRQQRPCIDDAGLHNLRQRQVGRFGVLAFALAGVNISESAIGGSQIDTDDVA